MSKPLSFEKVTKCVDPMTFRPIYRCLIHVDPHMYDEVKNTLPNFFEEIGQLFDNKIEEAKAEHEKRVPTYNLTFDNESHTYEKHLNIVVPTSLFSMFTKVAMPCFFDIEGNNISIQTLKTEVEISQDEMETIYNDSLKGDFSKLYALIVPVLEDLKNECVKYYYESKFSISIDPETHDYKYTYLIRVA